jgi:hypothetical protein
MMAKLEAVKEDSGYELASLLDQELVQLPEKYRVPIVLCDLEGKTRKEAARQLGWPEGTINGRLARGRAILAKRLARQGSALSGGAIAAVLVQQSASASMPVGLQATTLKAATMVAAGTATATGMVSAKVVALTEGIVKSMLLTKLKIVTAIAFLIVMIAIGGTLITGHLLAAQQRQPQKEPDPKLPKAAEEKKEPSPQTAKPLKADPTVDELCQALDISWWKFDLAKTVGAVEIGILEQGRFDLIQRYELSERDVPGILKIACQEVGGGYKLVVISNDGRMQMPNNKKPAEFSKTNGRGVKNGEYFELKNFKNSEDKGWKYALVIKIIEKPAQ